MSEIAACTLIQEEPDRKTERYLTMFKDYPDVVTVEHLQEMLGICRKNAYLLVKQNKIHSARVGRSYKIPKTLRGRVPARSGSATWRDAPFKLPCAILAKHSRIF